jgi:hypothetical protein
MYIRRRKKKGIQEILKREFSKTDDRHQTREPRGSKNTKINTSKNLGIDMMS